MSIKRAAVGNSLPYVTLRCHEYLHALNATWIQVIEKQLSSGTAFRIRSNENVVRKYYYETDS